MAFKPAYTQTEKEKMFESIADFFQALTALTKVAHDALKQEVNKKRGN